MNSSAVQFDWHSIVLTIAIIQGVILSAAILIFKSRQDKAFTFLGLTFLSYSFLLLDDVIFATGILKQYPILIDAFSPFIFAVAPTFYLYVRSVINPEHPFHRRDLLHYIPFILFVLLTLPNYFMEQSRILDQVTAVYTQDSFYFNPTVLIPLSQITVYMILVLLSIRRHGLRIKDEYSSVKQYNLSWFRYILGLVLSLWLGWLFCYFLRWKEAMNLLDLGYTFFIYLFAYFGWSQPTIPNSLSSYRPMDMVDSSAPKQITPVEKYGKSGLPMEQKREIRDKLKDHINQREPFLDPDLTLSNLAHQLNISTNYLSQVINEEFGQNFYELINSFRVEKVKQLLLAPESRDKKILTIALEAGFNSKSVFNASFKKFTGMTPKDFRK